MEYNSTVAIVTGGSSGLSGATGELLAGTGAKVTIFDVDPYVGAEHGLRARNERFALQTMCEGGGIPNVTIVEAL